MTFNVHAILGGLEDYVIWILTTAILLTVNPAILLELPLVLMEISPIPVYVTMDIQAITVQKISMNVKKILAQMVAIAPIISVDLNVYVLRDFLDIPVV